MAVPVVLIKVATDVAIRVGKKLNDRFPGIWWKAPLLAVVSFVTVAVLVVSIAITAIFSMIDPFLKGGIEPLCSVEVVDADTGGESSDNHGGDSGGGGGSYSTSGTPWPTTDSKTVVYPVPSPVLTSPWGYRPPFMVGGVLTPGYHNGLDFGQGLGSPVLSMADGVVASAYAGNSLYGSHIAIKHTINGEHYTSLYGHIQGPSIKVKVGDKVKAGQQIAGVGMEGMSTAAHLHFVLTAGDYSAQKSEPGWTGDKGNTIDPAAFLRNKGAGKAGGGLEGDNYSGVDDEGDMECDSSDDDFSGDGFSSWGGHTNGEIPADLLENISFAPDKKLLGRAAIDLKTLNTAYKEKFGKNLVVIRAYEAGGTGNSPFGWARAVELKMSFDTPEYTWMTQNAKKHGWTQPDIYAKGGTVAKAGYWGWKGTSNSAPPAATPDAEAARAIAKEILTDQYRWGEAEYVCLVKLWERESNWNPLADNPTSDAYGIPQSLPGEKMASEGSDWKTNPRTQIKWGLKYIKERYQTPCGAWAHSEAVNWY